MSWKIGRGTWVGLLGLVLLAGSAGVAVAATPALAVRFDAPTPAPGSTLTQDTVAIAFSYNHPPALTRNVTCRLTGPTPSTKACSAPAAAAGGRSASSVSYAGLAPGAYTFRVTVRLTDGDLDRATRRFTIATGKTLFPMHADYYENSSGRYLAVQAFTSSGGANGGTYVGPNLTATWRDASGAALGSGPLTPYVDGDTYVRHRATFRLGSQGTGGMPASVRLTATDGQSDKLPVKAWLGTNDPPHVAGFKAFFTTQYVDPVEQRAQLDQLAAIYPNLVSVVNLPEKTNGYQRKSQAIVGVSSGPGDVPPAAEQDGAIVLTSRNFGQDGGNQLSVWMFRSLFPNSPLSVFVSGSQVVVNLASDGSGNLTSTAQQVVAALNASPQVSPLLTASTFRGSAGSGISLPTSGGVALSDFLSAPPSVTKGPFQQHLYRIGGVRDGSKIGVLVSCQESGREWVTPLVCIEAMHRFVENYATDPETKALLDEVEIFVVPSVNPDAGVYSMYDFSDQSKNLAASCGGATDPAARNTWGVALGRNFDIGSIFDGFAGASSDCQADTYAGPYERSEPETRNLEWVMSTFPNIKFAASLSTGGSITWAPGAYREPGRVSLPTPSDGWMGYFRETARSIANGVYSARHTTMSPLRVDAGINVQGSEAGNSTDQAFYQHGVFAFDIGTGVPIPVSTTSDATIEPGFQPCYYSSQNPGETGNCPADGSLDHEGRDESLEFADGLYNLVRAAFAYARDITPPDVATTVRRPAGSGTALVNFTADDATDVYYTTDGSIPTTASTRWTAVVPGAVRQPLTLTQRTTVRWIAMDVKGNISAIKTRTLSP